MTSTISSHHSTEATTLANTHPVTWDQEELQDTPGSSTHQDKDHPQATLEVPATAHLDTALSSRVDPLLPKFRCRCSNRC